jgi:hypothetical protein
MSDQQSVCVGCKWAKWLKSDPDCGVCHWRPPFLAAAVSVGGLNTIGRVRDSEYGWRVFTSCPVRKPLKAQP